MIQLNYESPFLFLLYTWYARASINRMLWIYGFLKHILMKVSIVV